MKKGPLSAFHWAFALVASGALIAGCQSSRHAHSDRPVTFLSGDPAYSADPVDYDAGAHQLVFASVHAWLVSNYRVGAYEGQLAETWRSSKDFKEWTFTFRPNMRFENGDAIAPRDLADSWLRLIRVLKSRHSEPDALKNLVGYGDFPKRTATISGIKYDERSLTLRFSKPAPKFLSQITFGTYALVHPSCYDHKTGAWIAQKRTIASGPYRIAEWDGRHLLLTLRTDYPAALRHPRPLNQIDVRWDDDAKLDEDLIYDSSRKTKLAKRGFEYHGGAASGIVYVRVHSWLDPASPFSNQAFRRRIRLAFYDELERSSFHPDKSFFPLIFKGVHEMSAVLTQADASYTVPRSASIRYTVGDSTTTMGVGGPQLKTAVERLGLRFSVVAVPFEQQVAENISKGPHFQDDLAALATDIDLDDPDSDIRFMIGTKEGISLPDPTGRLTSAIRHSPIDMQKVNEILWDDAIIWPVTHQSSGIWARPELDFSLVNVLLPPTPLYLIGWKS